MGALNKTLNDGALQAPPVRTGIANIAVGEGQHELAERPRARDAPGNVARATVTDTSPAGRQKEGWAFTTLRHLIVILPKHQCNKGQDTR